MADNLTTAQKVQIAKDKKDAADLAFKEGNIPLALSSYHGALLYLLGLDKNALEGIGMASPPPPIDPSKPDDKTKERTEVDNIVEKIYANMCACHLKRGNWKRAIETADKALAKNENNFKAIFRKAKALSEEGYTERAIKLLEQLRDKSAADAPLATTELARLRALDKERERANNKKLKGFLSRDRGERTEKQTEDAIEAIESARIEEIPDDQ
ncbi:unnamed protein product [Mycena citricolor]|uniref:TPR-like protein n=1 Tax=Mycena citricolor TaxID=2018698 RepID=A0AAD2H5C3_9AGAR|nr:unnamed protein product [Mycena citricolor]CAK5269322.1 unnamed protein product [Mycena citricolor]